MYFNEMEITSKTENQFGIRRFLYETNEDSVIDFEETFNIIFDVFNIAVIEKEIIGYQIYLSNSSTKFATEHFYYQIEDLFENNYGFHVGDDIEFQIISKN